MNSKQDCGRNLYVFVIDLERRGGISWCTVHFVFPRYDPQTNQWSCDVAPTTSCRTSVGVAVLDGYLYAVGGQDGVQCLNHVER